jgi:hypothetical protein
MRRACDCARAQLLAYKRIWHSAWNLVDVLLFGVTCWMAVSIFRFRSEHAPMSEYGNWAPSWDRATFMLIKVSRQARSQQPAGGLVLERQARVCRCCARLGPGMTCISHRGWWWSYLLD